MIIYNLRIAIRYKSSLSVDFTENTTIDAINNAISQYNSDASDKKIIHVETDKDYIDLKIQSTESIGRPLKSISGFSKILVQQYEFDKYSSVEGKLFKAVHFFETTNTNLDIELSDDELVEAIKYLITFKDKGSNQDKRSHALKQIKNLVANTL